MGKLIIGLVVGVLWGLWADAGAQVPECPTYELKPLWDQQVAGEEQVRLTFEEYPSGYVLTTEYEPQGFTFGGEMVASSFLEFPLDGNGVRGTGGLIDISFVEPQFAFGAWYPRTLQLSLYDASGIVCQTVVLGDLAATGQWVGVVWPPGGIVRVIATNGDTGPQPPRYDNVHRVFRPAPPPAYSGCHQVAGLPPEPTLSYAVLYNNLIEPVAFQCLDESGCYAFEEVVSPAGAYHFVIVGATEMLP